MNEYQISFSDVLASSGMIGLFVWIWIFIFTSLGLILGISAIITSLQVKTNKYPLALKLLFCCFIAILLTGVYGTIIGYVDSFTMLGTTTCCAKAEALRLSTMMARMNINFAIFAAIPQLFFAVISLSIIESRAKKLSIKGLTIIDRIKTWPILTYPVIILSLPMIFGSSYAIWFIEKLITLKPDDAMPTLLGTDYSLILTTCGICSSIGVILMIILLLQISIKKWKEK